MGIKKRTRNTSYPERVVSMPGEKKLFSFVSVTDKEEIAGYTALKYCPEYPALMDAAIWVVKQKFRGFSLCSQNSQGAYQNPGQCNVIQLT